jgi:hypothetical protein
MPVSTSAIVRIADSSRTSRDVCFVPGRDSCSAANSKDFGRLCGAFNAAIDFASKHPEIDRLGQKRFCAIL